MLVFPVIRPSLVGLHQQARSTARLSVFNRLGLEVRAGLAVELALDTASGAFESFVYILRRGLSVFSAR